jgi:2-octaprenyl-6-methoxyphenol hydroxylase
MSSTPLFATETAPSATPIYDVAIVGGGVVGTLAACLLRHSGLRVALVEASARSLASDRGQAYSINQLSSQIFAGLGIWPRLRSQIETYRQVQLSDGDYAQVVHFAPSDIGAATLGYVAEHRVLLAELQDLLRQCENVDWLCPATVVQVQFATAAAPSELTLALADRQFTLKARLIIAADGSRSPMRQAAGIKTIGWRYWQSCVVAFVQSEKFHAHTAYERFQTEGPFAILPLPNGLTRIVWTTDHATAAQLLTLDRDVFLAQLRQRYGDQLGELTLVGEPAVFPVQLLHSRRYVQPGLALIGDAAHCCHPVGGQGINLGIRDAAAIAQVISAAHQKGESIAHLSTLKRYQQWRLGENLLMLAFTDMLTRTFSHNIWPIVPLRRLGIWALQHIQPIKTIALKLMLGMLGRVPAIAEGVVAADVVASMSESPVSSSVPAPLGPVGDALAKGSNESYAITNR